MDPLSTISALLDLISGPGLDGKGCIVRYVTVLCHPRNLPRRLFLLAVPGMGRRPAQRLALHEF